MIRTGSIDYKRGGFHLSLDSFEIRRGEKVALLGENGSGKSTLMHLMVGVLGSADVYYMENSIKSMGYAERARILSFLPQIPEVSFPFTVFEVVRFGRFTDARKADASTETSLKMADMYHLKDRPFSELSGGEKRRAMLARVINQDTPVQFFDEPVSMLDIRHSLSMLELMIDSEKTVITSIHDVNLALEYFDRLMFLKDGKMLYDVSRADVTAKMISEVFDVKVGTAAGRYSFYL
ncbi:ABC transporter related protein [Denitrovibrio acetiphilus DSM 12809]|uniref:ABC transporter related protein n=1 Tax=Denitrovibrio acetiphilus (strain DSM 12809 / NBRC 114555 / N2460) TaxID=522772 RepID=D4H1Z6_DENA2|nr:ABC transporter ATP-binding protein [Denitrovibrio acetiphilus]ADD66973.1 ABC transporter related protein [Denitrovibrio acetiphilus DSM 12809]